MTITAKQADEILSADLSSVEINVNRLIARRINQNQFDALVSFDFNTGGLARSTLRRDVNAGRFTRVADDLLMWVYAGGRVLRGLVRRRTSEGRLFNTPVLSRKRMVKRRRYARRKRGRK